MKVLIARDDKKQVINSYGAAYAIYNQRTRLPRIDGACNSIICRLVSSMLPSKID